VDTATRDRLVAEDARSAEIFKPYLRGQDVRRWRADWNGLWMILLKSSGDSEWPWSRLQGPEAENAFAATCPSLHRHLASWRDELAARSDQGRFWWELRACSYYEAFARPKILYQDITWEAEFALDRAGLFCNNTVYFIPGGDSWLSAVLNSPLLWWYSWKTAQHGKDEALRFFSSFIRAIPVVPPQDHHRETAERIINTLLVIQDERLQTRRLLLDWLAVEHEVTKPSQRLADPFSLSPDELLGEVRKARGKKRPLSATAVRNLRDEHAKSIAPLAERLAEVARLEAELADLVNQAYGLTAAEVDLLWQTAPPRMPVGRPLPAP
jgi:hypothetical protein